MESLAGGKSLLLARLKRMLMANNFWTSLGDKIQDEVWFQQIKEKWDNLEPTEKFYVKLGGLGSALLGSVIALAVFAYSTHSLTKMKRIKSDIALFISNSSDEIRKLRAITGTQPPVLSAPAASASPTPIAQTAPVIWSSVFDSIMSTANIDRSKVSYFVEKPGGQIGSTKELLYDVTVQEINLRQAVKLAVQLESASQPIKVRHVSLANVGALGAMNVKFAISAFSK